MLAGPSDRPGDGTADHSPAPWIEALRAAPPLTALRFGYIHDDDSFQHVPQVVDNWNLSGVPVDQCTFVSGGGYEPGCRRVHVASDACTGLAAHLVPILESWGARSGARGSVHGNAATWEHLLFAEE
jgi:hypothetical protein